MQYGAYEIKEKNTLDKILILVESNKEWLFSGVGVVLLTAVLGFWTRRKRQTGSPAASSSSSVKTSGEYSPAIFAGRDLSFVSHHVTNSVKLGGTGTGISRHWESFRYSFTRDPYVHPLVIKALAGLISDSSETIIAVDLDTSQVSNQFYGSFNFRKIGGDIWVFWEEEEPASFRSETFFYRCIGTSPSGIHILHCRQSTGGVSVFNTVILVALESDVAVKHMKDRLIPHDRLVLKTLGSIPLGDRYEGDIIYSDGVLRLGIDTSHMAYGGRVVEEAIPID